MVLTCSTGRHLPRPDVESLFSMLSSQNYQSHVELAGLRLDNYITEQLGLTISTQKIIVSRDFRLIICQILNAAKPAL